MKCQNYHPVGPWQPPRQSPCARSHDPASALSTCFASPRLTAPTACLAPVVTNVELNEEMPKEPLIAGRLQSQPAQLICDDAQTPRMRRRKWAQECEDPRGWQTGAERSQRVRTSADSPGNRTPLHGRSQRQGTSRGPRMNVCSVCEATRHAGRAKERSLRSMCASSS